MMHLKNDLNIIYVHLNKVEMTALALNIWWKFPHITCSLFSNVFCLNQILATLHGCQFQTR